jgi:hypothetical protein
MVRVRIRVRARVRVRVGVRVRVRCVRWNRKAHFFSQGKTRQDKT